jgi:hypothetical protein
MAQLTLQNNPTISAKQPPGTRFSYTAAAEARPMLPQAREKVTHTDVMKDIVGPARAALGHHSGSKYRVFGGVELWGSPGIPAEVLGKDNLECALLPRE